MLKVVWLGPYPVSLLQPELRLSRAQSSHPSSWIVNLAKELAVRDEIDLHILTAIAGISSDQEFRRDNITFHVLRHTFPFMLRGYPEYGRLDVITRYRRLRQRAASFLRVIRPDIVHAHGTEHAYGMISLDSVYPHVISLQGIITMISQGKSTMAMRIQARLEQEVIRRGKNFGSRTEWANQFVRSINPNAKIFYLPEAVHPLFFAQVSGRTRNRIVFVGRIVPLKGIEVALQAFSSVVGAIPNARLSIVGAGGPSYLRYLNKLCTRLHIAQNVDWHGNLSVSDLANLLGNCSLLIHPSNVDNSPNTVAEAMAAGLPVIATDVGGVASMVEDRSSGVLVPPAKPTVLAERIIDLLSDEPLRAKMGARGRELALVRHLPPTVANATIAVYEQILS